MVQIFFDCPACTDNKEKLSIETDKHAGVVVVAKVSTPPIPDDLNQNELKIPPEKQNDAGVSGSTKENESHDNIIKKSIICSFLQFFSKKFGCDKIPSDEETLWRFVKCPKCGKVVTGKLDLVNNLVKYPRVATTDETKSYENITELVQKGPDKLEDTAKTLITLISGLVTTIVAIFAFLKLSGIVETNIVFYILAATGFFFFMISILILTRVYTPQLYKCSKNNMGNINELFETIILEKYYKLLLGIIFFAIGLGILSMGFFWMPLSATDTSYNANLLVTPENFSILTDLGIAFLPGTNLTENLTVTAVSPKFRIKKNNTTIQFEPSIVKGILKTGS